MRKAVRMVEALKVRTVASRLGVLNVPARMPFRFGVVTIHAAAQAVLELEIETQDGRRAKGYAADFLSYKWFDKSPDRTPEQGSADLITSIKDADAAYLANGFDTAFAHWRELHRPLEETSVRRGYNRLGANFGVSMVERAMMDAIGRLGALPFDMLVKSGALGLDEPTVFSELEPGSIVAALPSKPLTTVAIRHTVGLVDPITDKDIATGDRVDDGFPETLEDYLRHDGVRYLKIKVSGEIPADIERLQAIWDAVERCGADVALTLDGNEQFGSIGEFAGLVDAVRSRPALCALMDAFLFIEQPVERTTALAATLEPAALDVIGAPLLIDEADGWTTAFREAVSCGYRGVSHKNCKGVFRSLLNNALAAKLNRDAGDDRYFLSAEDLSVLPTVSLQSDLATVATLGITHVERNGHHYFRGLDHLSTAERVAALQHHPDLYRRNDDTAALNVMAGSLDIGSLQTPGFGFAAAPDLDRLVPAEEWEFNMLAEKEHQ